MNYENVDDDMGLVRLGGELVLVAVRVAGVWLFELVLEADVPRLGGAMLEHGSWEVESVADAAPRS